ncbi:hypothetical protein I7I50_06992 [Histoplasma capsulatum G186AR]|nr:hypothetical protein I7I50_06992 [Histoplasma capsulatum G186AR]
MIFKLLIRYRAVGVYTSPKKLLNKNNQIKKKKKKKKKGIFSLRYRYSLILPAYSWLRPPFCVESIPYLVEKENPNTIHHQLPVTYPVLASLRTGRIDFFRS